MSRLRKLRQGGYPCLTLDDAPVRIALRSWMLASPQAPGQAAWVE